MQLAPHDLGKAGNLLRGDSTALCANLAIEPHDLFSDRRQAQIEGGEAFCQRRVIRTGDASFDHYEERAKRLLGFSFLGPQSSESLATLCISRRRRVQHLAQYRRQALGLEEPLL
ncbi:hypothetical protein [Sphingomonas sp. ABOLH]|uniref:hypothetical protein n=1 Tax=Sphingomonas sp. ABOLH TaxID=1985881 RepID=UPI000F7E4A65|nr:hypothetical protein [Sphingomonas sp. ABOLH]RSV30969.1 hypothetical protein CA237_07290 [Sphingomonas sp. ABOLH]